MNEYKDLISDPNLPFLKYRESGRDGLLVDNDTTEAIPTRAFRDMWEERRTNSYMQLEPYSVSSYELNGNSMKISDVIWGDMEINGSGLQPDFDTLLIRLARTPLLRRTQAIEQLTLGKDFATMPSSTHFSRWSHVWGSLVFVRKMNEGRDISPRENQVMQLRTLLSDVGHTAFSHLGDWMFQGDGISEDLHDKELKNILIVTGVEALLGEYGFSLDETVFPDVEDWIESPSPDLCVDRVDYGLREMVRWQNSFTGIGNYTAKLRDPQSLFDIVDGKLTIKDPDFAVRFAVGYSLLPTEHWSHPVHRLQLQLFQITMRRILTEKLAVEERHPREALYAIDYNFESDFLTWDVMNVVNSMKSIALSQRRFFVQGRKPDLEAHFRLLSGGHPRLSGAYEFPEFPDPLDVDGWQSKEFIVPHAANLLVESVAAVTVDPLTISEHGLRFALPALKSRSIDPHLISSKGDQQRLSEYSPSYLPYLEGQRTEMAKNYQVTVMMNPEFAKAILDKDITSRQDWSELIKRERNPKLLKETIEEAARWAPPMRFDNISEW
jgi:HD superfamily phosphohydrolase